VPQRRSYAPTPMNAPQTGNTGREMTPPNLAPQPQPIPPVPSLPQSPAGAQSLAPAPMNGGQTMPSPMGNRLPTSVPLSPAQPTGAPQQQQMMPSGGQMNALGTGTVDPWDVEPFLSSHDDLNQQEPHTLRLPHESPTTSANRDEQMPDDERTIPTTLLKMMGALGR
jgi:hypothetical protein